MDSSSRARAGAAQPPPRVTVLDDAAYVGDTIRHRFGDAPIRGRIAALVALAIA